MNEERRPDRQVEAAASGAAGDHELDSSLRRSTDITLGTRRTRIPTPLRPPRRAAPPSGEDRHAAFDRVCAALEAHQGSPPAHSATKARALCPAHGDLNPSLQVTAIEGSVLLHCHAGCDIGDVLDALGLAKRDLYEDPSGARYEYLDAGGRVSRVVTRTPDRQFSQEGGHSESQLFRLPRVVAAVLLKEVVYLVEGEKDVLALETLGVTATTAPMGATSFHRVDATPLRGATVVAVVDRDDAGTRWALQVQRRLREVGATVRFVQSASGKDSADHVAAGLGVDDFELYAMSNVAADDEVVNSGSSWAPVDLAKYFDGSHVPAEPNLLHRNDGVALLYPGLTHSFHGESESGKSMILQHEATRLISAGEDVLWLDFESDQQSVLDRLRLFGAAEPQILKHFHYVHPETNPFDGGPEQAAWESLLRRQYTLVVLDGVTDAMGLLGLQTTNNDEVAAWMRAFPTRLARNTGAAVVIVDHVTKDTGTRDRFAIGGQAKMAGLTGAGYTVAVDKPLGRGLRGVITLRIAKDRPGFIRGRSGPSRADRTQEAARVVVDSTGGGIEVEVQSPLQPGDSCGFRPTTLMERVSEALEKEELSFRGLREKVRGRDEHIRAAVGVLKDEGYLAIRSGSRNADLHASVRPYRQRDDEKSDHHRSGTHSATQDPP